MYYLVYYFHGTWKLCEECRERETGLAAAWRLTMDHLEKGHAVKLVPSGKPCGSRR